ncbi:MAG: hypothetical protein JWN22_2006 [Nocardioides sp.]|nr:hypothetical protein [Nocardioides sp.]
MRSTEAREETTVTIATALFVFVAVLGVGVGVAYAVSRFDGGHGVAAFLVLASLVLAAVMSLRYLVRHRGA